jgi:hypothetical protein
MLIVSGSYQNYQNGTVIVSNQLTDGGREKGCWGDSESVDV